MPTGEPGLASFPPAPVAGQPKHVWLREYLMGELASGRLKAGDLLPPEIRLAEELGMSRTTVRLAMAELEHEGLITRQRGRGTFIREGKPTTAPMVPGLDVFALVVPEMRGLYPELQRGVHNEASRTHRQVLVCETGNQVRAQADTLLQLLDRQVAGVVLVPITSDKTPVHHVRPLQRVGIPVVLCHRGVEGVRAPTLRIPFREVGIQAGRRLVEAGHQRVAFCTLQRYEASEAYEAGLRASLEQNGSQLPPDMVFASPQSINDLAAVEVAVEAFLDGLLALPVASRPTAIMATYDPLAELIYLSATRRGIRIPKDLSLVSFGGSCRESPIHRRLSAITVDETAAGAMATRILVEILLGQKPVDHNDEATLPIGFYPGETLASIG